jgi:hypothetical protein
MWQLLKDSTSVVRLISTLAPGHTFDQVCRITKENSTVPWIHKKDSSSVRLEIESFEVSKSTIKDMKIIIDLIILNYLMIRIDIHLHCLGILGSTHVILSFHFIICASFRFTLSSKPSLTVILCFRLSFTLVFPLLMLSCIDYFLPSWHLTPSIRLNFIRSPLEYPHLPPMISWEQRPLPELD